MAIGLWVLKAKPPKEISKKYPKTILLQIVTPFMKNWRNRIDHEDLELFEEYRKRNSIFSVLFFVTLLFFYIYLYFRYIY